MFELNDKLHKFIGGALAAAFLLFFFALGMFIFTATSAAVSLEDRALASTVYVGNGKGHGTGFVVGPNRIITARHVVDGAEKVTIKFSDTVERRAKVLWMGKDGNDVALLEADTGKRPALPLACSTQATRGEPVMIFGHPKFMTDIATYGKVSGFVTDPDLLQQEAGAVILDVTLAPGNSGGAVLDQRGYVLGIANAMIVAMGSPFGGVAGTGHAVMLPSSVICGLLNR